MLFRHFTAKNYGILDSRSPGRDLTLWPRECEELLPASNTRYSPAQRPLYSMHMLRGIFNQYKPRCDSADPGCIRLASSSCKLYLALRSLGLGHRHAPSITIILHISTKYATSFITVTSDVSTGALRIQVFSGRDANVAGLLSPTFRKNTVPYLQRSKIPQTLKIKALQSFERS